MNYSIFSIFYYHATQIVLVILPNMIYKMKAFRAFVITDNIRVYSAKWTLLPYDS